MKEVAVTGFIIGFVATLVVCFVWMVQAVSNQQEQNEKAFRAECAAVNGRAVWNNKYWECLK